LLRPGDVYHVNPQMVKKAISSHFHASALKRAEKIKGALTRLRSVILAERGMQLSEVLYKQLSGTENLEFNPYRPIQGQNHPIFALLDQQAQEEEEEFQLKQQFHPKPFIGPQIYLPPYLEISFHSCTGCFVRLPHIKADGRMEIPSPFAPYLHARTAMYYTKLGRRDYLRSSTYKGYRLYRHHRGFRRK
jgi:hypothetical protein